MFQRGELGKLNAGFDEFLTAKGPMDLADDGITQDKDLDKVWQLDAKRKREMWKDNGIADTFGL